MNSKDTKLRTLPLESRLFLHIDNDKRPITLADAFIMPDYKEYKSVHWMEFDYDDTLDIIIEKFLKYSQSSTMLITGVPGIGKSTITSWIANKYKEDDRIIILRFRDWDSEELEKGLLKAICNTLQCKKTHLDFKVLVLDGFDEMKSLNIRNRLLNSFFNDIKDIENIKCIITSRPHYINSSYFENVFELQQFDIDKVALFYRKISGNGLEEKEKIESNIDVLGIPVILYMAIMSNVDISENPTKPELYNRIFAQNGGIFDRFYNGKVGYGKGAQILRNSENIKTYLEFLQNVAFKMFESDSLSIGIEDYKVPKLEFQGDLVSILEFPIKHLFEGTENNIEFIHKSIYEYFVSEYLCSLICNMINENNSKEQIAGILGKLMFKRIPSEIYDFLQLKINNKLNYAFGIVKETFDLMLQDGMTFYTGECYKHIIECEMEIFLNFLDFLHLWENRHLKFKKSFCDYLKLSHFISTSRLNLRKIELNAMDLERVNLNDADLTEAQLIGTNLSNSSLASAKLIGANLRGANISKANLRRANLKDAKLQGAVLYDVNLYEANLDDSIWGIDDIKRVHWQLKDTHFKHIIITTLHSREVLSRSEYFNLYGK